MTRKIREKLTWMIFLFSRRVWSLRELYTLSANVRLHEGALCTKDARVRALFEQMYDKN